LCTCMLKVMLSMGSLRCLRSTWNYYKLSIEVYTALQLIMAKNCSEGTARFFSPTREKIPFAKESRSHDKGQLQLLGSFFHDVLYESSKICFDMQKIAVIF
jgi:hypothetical protein